MMVINYKIKLILFIYILNNINILHNGRMVCFLYLCCVLFSKDNCLLKKNFHEQKLATHKELQIILYFCYFL